MYDGYDNWPLDSNTKYRLMMRAFAREDISRNPDHPVNFFYSGKILTKNF